jgi:hypothetical protein
VLPDFLRRLLRRNSPHAANMPDVVPPVPSTDAEGWLMERIDDNVWRHFPSAGAWGSRPPTRRAEANRPAPTTPQPPPLFAPTGSRADGTAGR